MQNQIKQLLTEENGQGMVEYGLILGLIAIAVIGSMSAFGISMAEMFTGEGAIIQSIVDKL
jgi:pilus assembly protein Flp/PilA